MFVYHDEVRDIVRIAGIYQILSGQLREFDKPIIVHKKARLDNSVTTIHAVCIGEDQFQLL